MIRPLVRQFLNENNGSYFVVRKLRMLRRHLESVIVVMFTLCVKGEIYDI